MSPSFPLVLGNTGGGIVEEPFLSHSSWTTLEEALSELDIIGCVIHSQKVVSDVMAFESTGNNTEHGEDSDGEGWPAAVDVALEATRQEGCVQRASLLSRSS